MEESGKKGPGLGEGIIKISSNYYYENQISIFEVVVEKEENHTLGVVLFTFLGLIRFKEVSSKWLMWL